MRLALVPFVVLFVSSFAGPALAADHVECPWGSHWEDGSYCKPTVCASDTDCRSGEVCKPLPLCVEIGTKKPGAALDDAGPLLIARQRCGTANECPSNTTCLAGSRCVDRTNADKMGAPAPSSSASASDAPAKKSACGCSIPGSSTSDLGAAALAVAAVLAGHARRRTRRADRP